MIGMGHGHGTASPKTGATLEELFHVSKGERRYWLVLMGLALAAGVYFRFSGFFRWPLATDEYYIYRAMTFVLGSGLPEFPCGGYYTRGLLYQYLTAPLLGLGFSPEASLRFVAIQSNLAMLPAAYLLARRLGGVRIAAAAVTILALSTWEIEMARFGRMYAPFQAIAVWYAYHAYVLVESGDLRRWRWLLGLSLAAPLVWEGGIMLAAFNFLPMFLRRSAWSPRHLAGALAVLAFAASTLLIDFRYLGSAEAQPPPRAEVLGPLEEEEPPLLLVGRLLDLPLLAALFLPFAGLLVASFARIARYREPWLTVSFFAIAASVLVNQIALAVLLLLGALLVGWIPPRILSRAGARGFFLSLAGLSLVWMLVAVSSHAERDAIAAARLLISFPDLLRPLAYPWLLSMPLTTVFLGIGASFALLIGISRLGYDHLSLRLLLGIVIVSVTIIGAAQTSYNETRYSFHLYPILIALTFFGFSYAAIFLSSPLQRIAARAVPVACLLCWAASADFSLEHMLRIDSYAANFRVGYDNRRERHYYPRFDFRSPADYVNQHAGPADLVVATNVALTQYLTAPSAVYLSQTDSRFRGQACAFGERERWSGLPLLDGVEDIEALMQSRPGARLWLVADEQTSSRTLPEGYLASGGPYQLAFTSADQRLRVYERSPRSP